MKNILLQSIRALLVLTLITGVIYPLAVTLVGQSLFPVQAQGSLTSAGSALLAQKFSQNKYFWPRPSAGDYQTVASAASNLGPTSQKLKDRIAAERQRYPRDTEVPYELLMTSGSGLDPHISPSTAMYQAARVAQSRGMDPQVVADLITATSEMSTFGVLGRPRVNVLRLNLALDAVKK